MRINHNSMALYSYHRMKDNYFDSQNHVESLSSGFHINRAGDDAAGLSISEKMRAQIRGLVQGERNLQDGISVIQTVEAGLAEIHSIFQRVREISVQAANDTNNLNDRQYIQDEIEQLLNEVDSIGNTTAFNGQLLLNGSRQKTTEIVWKTELVTKFIDSEGIAVDAVIESQTYSDDIFSGFEIKDVNLTAGNYTITVSSSGYVPPSQFNGETMIYNGQTASTADVILNGKYDGPEDSQLVVTYDGSQITRIEQTKGTSGNIMLSDDTTYTGEDATWLIQYEGIMNNKLMLYRNGSSEGEQLVLDENKKVLVDGLELQIPGSTFEAWLGGGKWELDLKGGTYTVANGETTTSGVTDTTILSGVTIDISQVEGATAGDKWTKPLIAGVKPDYVAVLTPEGSIAGEWVQINPNGNDVILTANNNGSVLVNFGFFNFKNESHEIGFTTSETGVSTESPSTDSELDGTTTVLEEKVTVEVREVDRSMSIQIGPNANDTISLSIGDMRVESLGLNDITILTHEQANASIKTVSDAIEKVAAERTKLGGYQNRLEFILYSQTNRFENLLTAESRIRDVDMAKEVMELTRANILGKASQAMLTQANQNPQLVLQLLN